MQPPLIPGVARENLVELLGVTFINHLSFADYVRKLQIVARQRLYLLQLLKRQGLDSTCLDVAFKAIVLSTMLYAMPAFSGYLTESDINSLQAVINKAFKLGYLSSVPDLRSLIGRADRQLFNKLNTNLVLFPFCLLSATWKLVQHFVPGVHIYKTYRVSCIMHIQYSASARSGNCTMCAWLRSAHAAASSKLCKLTRSTRSL